MPAKQSGSPRQQCIGQFLHLLIAWTHTSSYGWMIHESKMVTLFIIYADTVLKYADIVLKYADIVL